VLNLSTAAPENKTRLKFFCKHAATGVTPPVALGSPLREKKRAAPLLFRCSYWIVPRKANVHAIIHTKVFTRVIVDDLKNSIGAPQLSCNLFHQAKSGGRMHVTIASVRADGVRQLLVYCLGKREGDWTRHHQGTLPIDRFQVEEVLGDIERRCRCTVCGWGRVDLRPDYSKQQAAPQNVGWKMSPG